MERLFEDKVVVVLGGGACGPGWGNGKAAAVAYAREGAKVAVVDLQLERSQDTHSIIEKEGGESIALAGDVSSAVDLQSVVDQTMEKWGRIDVLHNNIGVGKAGDAITLESTDWDFVMDVNVKSAFMASKIVLPIMLEQGGGAIVNISAVASVRVTSPGLLSYTVSKAALNSLTETIALSYADKGIRANAILPGFIDTPLIYANEEFVNMYGGKEKFVETRNAMCPTGKMGDAWDVANAAVFLASDKARYINGVTLPVDGGLIRRVNS